MEGWWGEVGVERGLVLVVLVVVLVDFTDFVSVFKIPYCDSHFESSTDASGDGLGCCNFRMAFAVPPPA